MTVAQFLGISSDEIVKRVLGHADQEVTSLYNQYQCTKEVRRVLSLCKRVGISPCRRDSVMAFDQRSQVCRDSTPFGVCRYPKFNPILAMGRCDDLLVES